jgi:hypothetical protein
MANPLPPGVARAVCREILVARNAVLDTILDGIVRKLVPIVEAEAAMMIAAAIDPDPKLQLLRSCYEFIGDMKNALVQARQSIAVNAITNDGKNLIDHVAHQMDAFLCRLSHQVYLNEPKQTEASRGQAESGGES